MFGKRCPNCKSRVNKDFEFCPYCGFEIALEKRKEGGLLDTLENFDDIEIGSSEDIEGLTKEIGKSMGFDFIDRFPFNSILKRLSKDIEKQFKDIDKGMVRKKANVGEETVKKDDTEIKKTVFPGGFSIQIRMGGAMPEHVSVIPVIPQKTRKIGIKQVKGEAMKSGKEEFKRISKLTRKEPETRVRRLTDKVIYEILLPGITSIKNVAVNKLENSIEIKAITENTAYFKLIPVALPLKKYYLNEEKLILELSPGA